MRLTVASARGMFSGWLAKATLPLLLSPHAIAEWTTAGVGDWARVALALAELSGAALFAFERSAVAGFILLTLSFGDAAVIHMQHGQMPWRLGGYFVAGALLVYWTRYAVNPVESVPPNR